MNMKGGNVHYFLEVQPHWDCTGTHTYVVALALGVAMSSRSQPDCNSQHAEGVLTVHIPPCVAQSNMVHLPSALWSRLECSVAHGLPILDTCLFAGEYAAGPDRSWDCGDLGCLDADVSSS